MNMSFIAALLFAIAFVIVLVGTSSMAVWLLMLAGLFCLAVSMSPMYRDRFSRW